MNWENGGDCGVLGLTWYLVRWTMGWICGVEGAGVGTTLGGGATLGGVSTLGIVSTMGGGVEQLGT